ncbi:hypothetical protein BJF93_05475 [Xaviernesmea oryzae]|uniref:Uncharacterized protein n=1 Tax=Xaviernesmea oryzae TaxID=464029 RepID=A0A1Q9ARM8_9HYPH|nr:hypothetical protein [Xaviernesmea oryzae]OLP58084.1 hypothetical protein BJF93_05475 [Xaviernesmea oryzae]SEL83293.1 hypothetical protein SAMN04487976_113110 [Xaviernesmea oryzae]
MVHLSAHLLKSALAVASPSDRWRETNVHIGQTLKALYFNGEAPHTEGVFTRLLDKLDDAEEQKFQPM